MKTFSPTTSRGIVLTFLFFLFQNINAQVMVSTLAGSTSGFSDGIGNAAQFNAPYGVAVSSDGTIYLADTLNNRIRKISTTGEVTTFAGSSIAGFADGNGTAAQFNNPMGVAVGLDGTVYVVDSNNFRIRKITANGEVTTLAGSTSGFANGIGPIAKFFNPQDIKIGSNGLIYVADTGNHSIRKITINGEVTTIAGSGTSGYADGIGATAKFYIPSGIEVTSDGTLYIADTGNNRIRKITADGVTSTFAGSGTAGFADGSSTNAKFNFPGDVVLASDGSFFVGDTFNNRIRRISTNGEVTTLTGTNTSGFTDGIGTFAQFNFPISLTIDVIGTIFVADNLNHRIRKITGAVLTTNHFQLENQATYYPNPTTGILNINYSKEISAVSVVNLLGQTVLTQTNSGMTAQLDLSALTDGTYIIKMVSDGKTQTFKVLKGI